MSFSDVQDSVLNTRNFTEYAYDAFGRRIETKEYLGDYTRNLYDGFTFDVLGKSVLQSAYSANVSAQKYRDGTGSINQPITAGRNERGSELGTRYRYIDETPLVPMTEAGKANGNTSTSSTAKTRSRPNSEFVLYSYGEPVAMSADGNASYFSTDILGSVRSVTDKYGTVQADYSYDVFGSPYLGSLENDIGFGYCGKVYDIGTGLYDYGFRDYSPVSARFTTIDPIRDGSNWFSQEAIKFLKQYDKFFMRSYIIAIIFVLFSFICFASGSFDSESLPEYKVKELEQQLRQNKNVKDVEVFKTSEYAKFCDVKVTLENDEILYFRNHYSVNEWLLKVND